MKPEWKEKQVIESLSYSCVRMAEEVDAKVIATKHIPELRHDELQNIGPKYRYCIHRESGRTTSVDLVWGVQSVKLKELFETDRSVQLMEEYLLQQGLVQKGDRVVIATGIPITQRGRTNMIKISVIE